MSAPPFLIMHGSKDEIVPFNQSELLAEALQQRGRVVSLHRVEGAGHGFRDSDKRLELIERAAAFFDLHLKDVKREGDRISRVGGLTVPDGVSVKTDVPYRDGDNGRWRLDLVLPGPHRRETRPALLFIHGGGWRFGDKRRDRFLGPALEFASRGYVCLTVNYRLLDEAPLSACVADVKSAVRWLRAHAERYGVDPNAIGAYGNSAGAHLAVMLALSAGSPELDGDGPWREQSSGIQAVVASATPADLTVPMSERQTRLPETDAPMPGHRLRNRIWDLPEETRRLLSPISYVGPDAPPMLLLHETHDPVVGVHNSDTLVSALERAGAKDVTYMRYEDGTGHTAFFDHPEETGPAREAFFARTLGSPERARATS
jgi:acetyl esterase/lipase